jgi:hypothetical protein
MIPVANFDDLFNLVCHPDFLSVAWDRVRGKYRSTHGRRGSSRSGVAELGGPAGKPAGHLLPRG